MNSQLEAFARNQIKEGLNQLPEAWQEKFKRMYGSVDTMPSGKLDWAMQQVENSLKKLEKTMSEQSPRLPMREEDAARFHAAARMIETDGVEGYFTCRERFGPEVAGATLVAWLRAQNAPAIGYWPGQDDEVLNKVNQIMRESGRMA